LARQCNGYSVGVFSSRRMERRLVEDIAFRVLAADKAGPGVAQLIFFAHTTFGPLPGTGRAELQMSSDVLFRSATFHPARRIVLTYGRETSTAF
jgi:hypothetical protein